MAKHSKRAARKLARRERRQERRRFAEVNRELERKHRQSPEHQESLIYLLDVLKMVIRVLGKKKCKH